MKKNIKNRMAANQHDYAELIYNLPARLLHFQMEGSIWKYVTHILTVAVLCWSS